MAGIDFNLINTASQPNLPVIAKPVDDFMAAFRSGFITTDDIRKRLTARASDEDNLKTQLSDNDLKRKQNESQTQLLPADFELKKRGQGVQGQELGLKETVLPAQKILAEKEALDVAELADPVKRPDALNRKRREGIEYQYAQTVGELPPHFELEKPGKPLDFDKWAEGEQKKVMDAADKVIEQSGQFPQLDSPEANAARAQAYNRLEADFLTNAKPNYAKYVQETATSKAKVERGTPEYDKELSRQLTTRLQKDALQKIQLDAYGKGLNTAAEEGAKGPSKALEAGAKLRGEVEQSKPIQNFRLQANAADQVRTLANIPNPSNRTDLQLIYAAVKLADPGSVVREGEIALSRQADPVLVAMKKKLEGITSRSNKMLDATDRAELVRVADAVFSQAKDSIRPEYQKFDRLAKEQGIPVLDIVNPHEAEIITGATTAAPANTQGYEALVGKTVTLKNGQTGVVIKNADGTYSLQ